LRYDTVALASAGLPQRRFLIIDQNPDSLTLLSRTLVRKFPHAVIVECVESDDAVRYARVQHFDAIVVHRALGMSAQDTVRGLREANANFPIVMMSSVDQTEVAVNAGASSFLHFDAWLMLGSVVADLIKDSGSSEPWPTP
jgi:DNA-binding response OmpR family regulator